MVDAQPGESRLRDDALSIFHAGLKAVEPSAAVGRSLRLRGSRLLVRPDVELDLDWFDRVIVVGAGKASAPMVVALEDLLGDRIVNGIVNVKAGPPVRTSRVELIEAGHPTPNRAGEMGARRIVELVADADEHTLVLAVISGGGSALLPLGAGAITLEDKQQTTRLLLEAGATIQEMNAVRKHMSSVKGGQLARLAYPATVFGLIISDVVGDALDVIASGPTAPDKSTFADAQSVLERHGVQLLLVLPA